MSDLSIRQIIEYTPGEGIQAEGRIPEHSEFFQDHFPNFPVLPGVLALEMLKQTAEVYLKKENADGHFFLKKIRSTKFHTYLKPGDTWQSRLHLISVEGDDSQWEAKLFHDGKLAVSAKIVLSVRKEAARPV